ncbi:MAG: hydroxymethylbilane synthase [Saprospiraceae bacterium]|jgi:hydroxymethylbilane synthase|nr:hydroxymethylbilane synthase [Saprospiraceae bacterium]
MDKIKIVCRASKLSLIQADIVRSKIALIYPDLSVVIEGIVSRGDRMKEEPLSALSGIDFFTEDIYQKLITHHADIAVHSLKDMSSEHFFSHDSFAVVDRDISHDVAIFNPEIIEKIKKGSHISIGTSSPRRETMAIPFLRQALPQNGDPIHISAVHIRGNVDTRLTKLNQGNYDGIILAAAGINRLLNHKGHSKQIQKLLWDKKIMFLPLIECTPAPCQGMVVAECHPEDIRVKKILSQINSPDLLKDAIGEKKLAIQKGPGCSQKFGVTTIRTKYSHHHFASGKSADGNDINDWTHLHGYGKYDNIFATHTVMKDFFEYLWYPNQEEISTNHVFVANPKIAQQSEITKKLKNKMIWAAGSKTWFELAKAGLWVSGCTDGLGFDSIRPLLDARLTGTTVSDITMLTHNKAAIKWQNKGVRAIGYYDLIPKKDPSILNAVANADFIFWSSFSQYSHYHTYAKLSVTHASAAGETAESLLLAGINPIIFPTLKAFEQWRTHIQ